MNSITAQNVLKRSAHVQGWFSNEAGMLIAMVDEFQKTRNITGDIFEIGVHHGKSSIFFSHLLLPSENLHICDIFGEIGNVSSSGSGNEDVFKQNMATLGAKSAAAYHVCLSTDLTTEKIGRNYRMFHIDGGHNPDEALSDLALAAKVLHEEGVIILDDPFRVEWPGVSEALVRFLYSNSEFEAIAVGFNKLLLTKKGISQHYKDFINDLNNRENYKIVFPWEFKQLPFAGNYINIFFIPTRYTTIKSTKVWVNKILLKNPKLHQWLTKLRN